MGRRATLTPVRVGVSSCDFDRAHPNMACLLQGIKSVVCGSTKVYSLWEEKTKKLSSTDVSVPVEHVNFPFVSDSHEEIARRGGLSRRLFVPVPNVIHRECRESKFRLYQFTLDDPKHGRISKTLDRLDAIECAVFY